MKFAIRVLCPVAVVAALVGAGCGEAFGQGCCKAGLCRIPTLPKTSAQTDNLSRSLAAPSHTTMTSARSAERSDSVAQVSLVNPLDSGRTIEYMLDGVTHALEPGMTLTLRGTQPRKIEYLRGAAGDKTAKAQYRVSRGMYEFAMTDGGWQLYRTE
jgi:hypothetical protein